MPSPVLSIREVPLFADRGIPRPQDRGGDAEAPDVGYYCTESHLSVPTMPNSWVRTPESTNDTTSILALETPAIKAMIIAGHLPWLIPMAPNPNHVAGILRQRVVGGYVEVPNMTGIGDSSNNNIYLINWTLRGLRCKLLSRWNIEIVNCRQARHLMCRKKIVVEWWRCSNQDGGHSRSSNSGSLLHDYWVKSIDSNR